MPKQAIKKLSTKQVRLAAGLCPLCGVKPEEGFQNCSACRTKLSDAARRKYADDRKAGICRWCDNPAEIGYSTCATCREKQQVFYRTGVEATKQKGLCLNCRQTPSIDGKRLCETCNEKALEANRADRERIKILVFAAYGNACSCCGEDTPEFLAIDHIDGGGSKHRKEIGSTLYCWLIKNGFPKDKFRLLCHNCNMGRQINGGVCPHVCKNTAGLRISEVNHAR